MKYSVCLAVIFFAIGWSLPAHSQEDDESSLTYKKWQLEQRKAIQLYIDLEEYEKSAFWTVYDSYCRAIENLEIEHIRIHELYRLHSGQLTEDENRTLAKYLLKNDLVLTQVRQHYFKKFQRTLSPSKATEFMQLEHSLRTVFRLNLQERDPATAKATTAVFSTTIQ